MKKRVVCCATRFTQVMKKRVVCCATRFAQVMKKRVVCCATRFAQVMKKRVVCCATRFAQVMKKRVVCCATRFTQVMKKRVVCCATRWRLSARTCACFTRTSSRGSAASRRGVRRGGRARDADRTSCHLPTVSRHGQHVRSRAGDKDLPPSHRLTAHRSCSSVPRPRSDAPQRHPAARGRVHKGCDRQPPRGRLCARTAAPGRRRRVHHRGELDAFARAVAGDAEGTVSGLHGSHRRPLVLAR